jgi:hypothetical protein
VDTTENHLSERDPGAALARIMTTYPGADTAKTPDGSTAVPPLAAGPVGDVDSLYQLAARIIAGLQALPDRQPRTAAHTNMGENAPHIRSAS